MKAGEAVPRLNGREPWNSYSGLPACRWWPCGCHLPSQEAILRDNVTGRINQKLQHIIDETTEREKHAKIVHAEGEFEAARKLTEAADIMAQHPVSVQLRYLQTLTEISVEKNSTIIFPVPVDLLEAIMNLPKR